MIINQLIPEIFTIARTQEKKVRHFVPKERYDNKELIDIAYLENFAPGMLFLFNIQDLKYDYISPSLSSVFPCATKDLMDYGFHRELQMLTPFHQQLFATQILPTMSEFFIKTAASAKSPLDLRIKYLVDMYDKNSNLVKTLHIIRPISVDENGMPSNCLKYIIILDHYAKDEANIVIESCDEHCRVYTTVYSKIYRQPLNNNQFSERELEVYSLAKQGHTSKEISEKLFISIHTVNNHRKNILKKSDCKNLQQISSKS